MVRRAGRSGGGEQYGYLPVFQAGDRSTLPGASGGRPAFPDNWTVGLSFFHNLFVANTTSSSRSSGTSCAAAGRRFGSAGIPMTRTTIIRYRDVTPDELFQIARLVVAAEIRQDPHDRVDSSAPVQRRDVQRDERELVGPRSRRKCRVPRPRHGRGRRLGQITRPDDASQWYSVFASPRHFRVAAASATGLASWRRCSRRTCGT